MLAADLGDIDGNGVVDALDMDLLAAAVRQQSTESIFDINEDGTTDRADIDYLVREVLGTLPGDVNLDGAIAFGDFLQLAGGFGKSPNGWSAGDFNLDGQTDFADFLELAGSFGFESSRVRFIRFVADSEVEGDPWAAIAELDVLDATGQQLDKSDWRIARVSSEELVAEFAPASLAIDNDIATFWHTEWAPDGTENDPSHPHELVVDLGGYFDVGDVIYTPRQDLDNGRVKDFRLYQSRSLEAWGDPFASGRFLDSLKPQIIRGDQIVLANSAPELAAIPNQYLSAIEAQLKLPLAGSDKDGDGLTFNAVAYVDNPLAEIRDTYGLEFGGDYYQNLTGLDEKWLRGKDGTSFFILANGNLVQWQGGFSETAARESLIASLDESVYELPSKLWDAAEEVPAPALVRVEEGHLILEPSPGIYGQMRVVVSASDGIAATERDFVVSIEKNFAAEWSARISNLAELSKSLAYGEIPSFIAKLSDLQSDLNGRAAAELSDLIRTLQRLYADGQQRIQAAADWQAQANQLLENRLETIRHIQKELEVLQAEYDTAWTAISSRLEQGTGDSDMRPPIFVLGADIGPFEVGVGDTFELDLSAIHPTDHIWYYLESVADNDLGQVIYHPQTGEFRWSVRQAALGIREFTVVAEAENGLTSKLTFKVNVVSNEPIVGSVSASPAAITELGSDIITLTATGVRHPSGHVDAVEFWLDADRDGKFDPDRYGPPRNSQEFYGEFIKGKDHRLGIDVAGDDGWSWSGTISGLEPGLQTVFVRSEYSTQGADLYSEAVSVTIDVIETPRLDLLLPTAPSQSIPSRIATGSPSQLGRIEVPQFDSSLGVLMEAKVDVYPVAGFTDAAAGLPFLPHGIAFDVGPFAFSGTALPAPASTPNPQSHGHPIIISATSKTFYGHDLRPFEQRTQSWQATNLRTADSGHRHEFAAAFQTVVQYDYRPIEVAKDYAEGRSVDVYQRGGVLYAQWYVNGRSGLRKQLVAHADSTVRKVEFAVDGSGNIIVVYHAGSYTDEDVYFVTARADGTITQGPERLNSRTTGWYKNPAVAMNSKGEGVIAWNDQDNDAFNNGDRPNQFVGSLRTFRLSGADIGPEVEFHGIGAADASVAAAINEAGDYLVGWSGFYTRGTIRGTDQPVAISNGDIVRNSKIAMHDSGWAVTVHDADRLLWADPQLQVLDATGNPVGSRLKTRPGLIDLRFVGANEIAAIYRPAVGSQDYHREVFRVDLSGDISPRYLSIVDPRSLAAGEVFEVDFEVSNQGPVDSQSSKIGFYLSHDTTISAADRIIGSVQIDALPGETSSGDVRASLVMPDNSDPFWNEGTTDLHLLMSIVGADVYIADIPFVLTRPIDNPTDGGSGATDDDGAPDLDSLTGPYIRPQVEMDQLGEQHIKFTYDTIELIGRQMVAALQAFGDKASEVDADTLAGEIYRRANRIQLGLDTYIDEKWDSVQAQSEAEKSAKAELDKATEAAEQRRLEEQNRRIQQRNDVMAANQSIIDREKGERDRRIGIAESSRDETIDQETRKYNDAVKLYNKIVDGGVNAFRQIVGVFRDPLKAFRDARDAAQRAIDRAAQAIDEAELAFLRIRRAILNEFGAIIKPFQDAIDRLPSLRDIQDAALAIRDQIVKDAEAIYEDAVEELGEDFGDGVTQAAESLLPILADPGIAELPEKMQGPNGDLGQLLDEIKNLPSKNPIGSPAEIQEALTQSTTAITPGRLEDMIWNALPPEAKHAAGDFVDWAKDTGGDVAEAFKDAGAVVSRWIDLGADLGPGIVDFLGFGSSTDEFIDSVQIKGIYVIPDAEGMFVTTTIHLPDIIAPDPVHQVSITLSQNGQAVAETPLRFSPAGHRRNLDGAPGGSCPDSVVEIKFPLVQGSFDVQVELLDTNGDRISWGAGEVNLEQAARSIPIGGERFAGHYVEHRESCGGLHRYGNLQSDSIQVAEGVYGHAKVTAETEAEATSRRGFSLPYVLQAADLYAVDLRLKVDQQTAPEPECEPRLCYGLMLGLDMLQTTAESTVEVEVTEVDENWNDNSEAKFQSELERFVRERRRYDFSVELNAGLVKALEAFPEWMERYKTSLSYEEERDFSYQAYLQYYTEFPDDLPTTELISGAEEFWKTPVDQVNHDPPGVWLTGDYWWNEFFEGVEIDGETHFSKFFEALEAKEKLESLLKNPPVEPKREDFSTKQTIRLTGSEIQHGVDLSYLVQYHMDRSWVRHKVVISAGTSSSDLAPVQEFKIGNQVRDWFQKGLEGTLQSIGEGLETFVENWPAHRPPKWEDVSKWVHNGLAVAGLTPGIGIFADAADAVLYAIEDNWQEFAIAIAAMVPMAGQAVTAGKFGGTAADVVRIPIGVLKSKGQAVVQRAARKTVDIAENLRRFDKQIVDIATRTLKIDPVTARHFQIISDSFDVIIAARPVNPAARRLLKEGSHLPKPTALKMKTINSEDLLLGAKGKPGEVALFKPNELPANAPDALKARHRKRMDEWEQWETNSDYVPDGYLLGPDGVIRDRASRRPFTGDNDVFVILDRNGAPLYSSDTEKYKEVMSALRVGDTLAQHGDLAEFAAEYTQPDDVAKLAGLVWQHVSGAAASGSEALGIFLPNKPPAEMFADVLLLDFWLD